MGTTIIDEISDITGADKEIVDGYVWFYYDGNTTGSDLTFSFDGFNISNKMILVVDNANLIIGDEINTVDGAGFFMALVSGDIIVDPSVGDLTYNTHSTGSPHLEGLYIAGGNFETGSYSDVAIPDNQLIVRGSVVADTYDLDRDLYDDNATYPAEIFRYGYDTLFMVPKGLRMRSIEWKEVPP
jgi:hypothetical protein